MNYLSLLPEWKLSILAFIELLLIIVPILIGYAVLLMFVWSILKRVWNLLWKGMDEEKRYEYTTITFKTKKW
jgi:hypothetical protein